MTTSTSLLVIFMAALLLAGVAARIYEEIAWRRMKRAQRDLIIALRELGLPPE